MNPDDVSPRRPLEQSGEILSDEIGRNIERYLNNHTREGGKAWQMNMAARPENWKIIAPPRDGYMPQAE